MKIDKAHLERHPDGIGGQWLYRLKYGFRAYATVGEEILDGLVKGDYSFAMLKPIDKDGNVVELKPKPLKVGDAVRYDDETFGVVVDVGKGGIVTAIMIDRGCVVCGKGEMDSFERTRFNDLERVQLSKISAAIDVALVTLSF